MPNRRDFQGPHNERGKRQARQAIERGLAAGYEWVAIYMPGEEVRCPGLPGEPDVCGGFLFVRGQSTEVHVRAFEEQRAADRRTAARHDDRRHGDTHRCPRYDYHRLEVESPVTGKRSA